ncbi:replication factor C subunit 3/5 [Acrasis kona]|uniref:Replication factor C subunit 3/5 n=1 Tax=Acrasis kona TaxID=1008807 RepID=A0AAW2Z2N4_9EUKA
MVLLVDKYRPKSFDKMDIHKDMSQQLKNIVNTGDFPHLLFYGPSGAGKKTRVMALLKEVYGVKAEKTKLENKEIKVGSQLSKSITVTTLSSPCHIEINPSDSGNYDRYVIGTLLKEIAQSAPLDQSAERNFKVVIINEVDLLSREAQQALRRTMEKYVKTCRLVLMATSISKILSPIKSRCLCIRVPAPTSEEISTVLQKVAKQEVFNLPKAFCDEISEKSEGNLRRALLMLEASKAEKYPFTAGQKARLPEWERFIADIAKEIMEDQSPKRLLEIREKYYQLITNCIPPELILQKLANYLIVVVDYDVKHQVSHWSAFYEHRLKCGSRPIFHLEAFTAKIMSVYKRYVKLLSFVNNL